MIHTYIFRTLLVLLFAGCSSAPGESPPEFMMGNFRDDYGIHYQISKDTWIQQPNAIFHIEEWNPEEQYLIARNNSENPSEAGMYSRFDWMTFEHMLPYEWGFCITVYNAETMKETLDVSPPDREYPKEGCNGFPFSRMRADEM